MLPRRYTIFLPAIEDFNNDGYNLISFTNYGIDCDRFEFFYSTQYKRIFNFMLQQNNIRQSISKTDFITGSVQKEESFRDYSNALDE